MNSIGKDSTVPQRIWLVNLFFGPGLAPTGVLLESLALDLERQGWLVEVLAGTAEYRADVSGESSRFQGKIHRFRCRSTRPGLRGKFWTWIWFYTQVAWFSLWRRMPSVIVVQTTPPFLHTIFAFRRLFCWRRPVLILWNQDTYPETLVATEILREKSWAYWFLKHVARWSGRRVAKAVALDGAMADRLRGQGIHDVRVIPNWDVARQEQPQDVCTNANCAANPLDTPVQSLVLTASSDANPARNSLPDELIAMADGYRFKIAYTGNLGFGHDLTPLWDFIANNPSQTELFFLFVGEGDRTQELKQLVERNQWRCVKFWPYLPASEFQSFLDWADFGLVALEMNCLGLMSPSKMHAWLGAGKPVIYVGPEGSNVTETVRAYDCGFIVDPREPQSFASVAQTINDTDFNVSSLRDRAKRAWRERHSSTVGLKSWQAALED